MSPSYIQMSDQVQSDLRSLEDALLCVICAKHLREPRLCPQCVKAFCSSCVTKWLQTHRTCPQCSMPLRCGELLQCGVLAELSGLVERVTKTLDYYETCSEHNLQMLYFCKTCGNPICSDCAMITQRHHGHEFDKLANMYDFHLRVLRTEEGKVKSRKEELRAVLGDIEENLEKLKQAHGEKSEDLRGRIDVLRGRLEAAYKEKAVQLVGKQRFVSKEIEQFHELLTKVSASLGLKSKAHLIANAPTFLGELRQVNLESQGKVDFLPQSPEYSSVGIAPQYESGSFLIEQFSRYRNSSEVLYSDPLPFNGMNWRLKVYPNGNGFAMGVYVSLFLEMRSSLSGVSKYEYKVEMENRRDPHKPMVREFASEFESGECWGYNRFIRIDALCDEGFLDPEEDRIFLKYYVRAQSFAQQCRDQQRYIDFLENDKQRQSDHLGDLRTRLQTYESPAKAVRLPSPPVIISAENPLEHIGDNVEVRSEDEQVKTEEEGKEEESRSDDDLEAMTRKLKLLSQLRLQERRKRQHSSEASRKSSESSEEANPGSWQEDEEYRSSGSDLSELDVPRPNPSSEAQS